ncbi:type VII secretion system-associated protein [Saccharopolyspora hirsuta]|uniref:Type VII secretion system-associated protein n=1 Tax=Saccharopolyspora hirsuta TaxID=1837 RepID=A0A5M7BJI9_SACHI|nr:type VII secretion system-associated protein [Saccharopolyspora hirsuta]KAA5829173.1 type VII secretion system-associated protein [Saccharopolyspora hirsuta]
MSAEPQWVFLIDPSRQQRSGQPPRSAVVGGWYVEPDGTTGRFHANPDYEPGPDSPTDPLDAALRLAARGELQAEQLLAVLGEAAFGIAVDDAGAPVVAPAPDGVPTVLVTSAPAHRARVQVAAWRDATAAELSQVLSAEGVDALINPGSTASMRILAEALRRATAQVP